MNDSSSLLTLLTLTPFLGALVAWLLASGTPGAARRVALAFAGLAAALNVVVALRFELLEPGVQMVQRLAWIPSLKVDYHVGVDGLGLVMISLTSLVLPMAMLVSTAIKERPTAYFALLLTLQGGLYGAFTALNFFHWFLFWELSLIPAFFLIRFWGGARRAAASVQFFVYTMVGSIALLVAFLGLFLATGTFDFIQLADLARQQAIIPAIAEKLRWAGWNAEQVHTLLALGVLLGFAVKVPLMPFHSWLPDTYAEASSPVTMVLTGVMSKLGIYGLLRLFLPVFPRAIDLLMTLLLGLAVATIVLSAFAALAQKDLKRMFAYSSINHLGYCLLGIFAAARPRFDLAAIADERAAMLNGVVLQVFSHGLTAAALFGFVAFLESRTGGRRGVDDFGGLRRVAPVFAGLMGITMFASLGLPGLSGFVGEFLIFKGVFAAAAWAAVLALPGLLVTAVFLLTVMQKVFHGPLNAEWNTLPDLDARERFVMVPAVALMFVLGVLPGTLVRFVNSSVSELAGGLGF